MIYNLRMNQISLQFLDTFKIIEEKLNLLAGFSKHLNFPELVEQTAKINTIVRDCKYDLLRFSDLRNLLVHGEEILQVSPLALEKINKILNLLEKPPTVAQVFGKSVTICDYEDPLLDVLNIMRNNLFTHIPVYKRGKFYGVISEAAVASWVAGLKNGRIELAALKISDLGNYLKNRPDEIYKFTNQHESAYEVRDWFLHFTESGSRLGAVFITPTGNQDEPLLGIITAWDIPKIKEV